MGSGLMDQVIRTPMLLGLRREGSYCHHVIVLGQKLGSDDKWAPVELGPITVEGGNVLLSQALPTQTQELTGKSHVRTDMQVQDRATAMAANSLQLRRWLPLLTARSLLCM
jgi:hypothetical protein